jgi:uncharacterized protein YggE
MRTLLRPLSAALLLMLMAAPLRAADAEPPSISTTGEAIVYVVPDKVTVSLGAVSHDSDLDKAKALNDAAVTSLLKAITGLGIDTKDISTDRVQVDVHYRNSSYAREIDGYSVRRGYAITLKDPKLLEKLVDAALKNGANEIGGIAFETTDLRKFRDQARQMAVKAAKEKAEALAKELDCKVGRPTRIAEGGGGSYFGGYSGANRSMLANGFQNAVQTIQGGGEDGETMPLGKIAVQASVSVTFELK